MRVMIGYNGSSASSAIFEDLTFAGLPPKSEIRILVVADPLIFPKTEADANGLAESVHREMCKRFPNYVFQYRLDSGDAAGSIAREADGFHPDMIILGEPGSPDADGHFKLGPVSQKVISNTTCSVRISRAPGVKEARPARVLVGYDGSAGSKCAVESLLSRTWPNGLEVRFVSVADSSVLSTIGRFAPQIRDVAVSERYVQQWAETLCERSRKRLSKANILSDVAVRFGDPVTGILNEAIDWRADAILVGPHSASSISERSTLGSVSLAVAAGADRSVEICRCFS